MVKKHLGIVVAEDVVDVDADEDTYFLDAFQLLAQFEVSTGTEIADHGME